MAAMFGRNVKKNTAASSRGKTVEREMPPSVHRKGGGAAERPDPPISRAAQQQRKAAAKRKQAAHSAQNAQLPRNAQPFGKVYAGKPSSSAAASASRRPAGSNPDAAHGGILRGKPQQKRRMTPARTTASPKITKAPQIKMTWGVPAKFDYPFFFIIMILLAFGLVMLFSASYAVAYSKTGDSFYYLKRQLLFAGLGFIAMIGLSFIPYKFYKTKAIMTGMVLVSTGLMLLVKVAGTTQGGAERWIDLGFTTIQPSEILKFVVIVVLAYYLEMRYEQIRDFKKGFIPAAVIVCISCAMVAIQPHLSGTIIIFSLCITLLLVGGSRPRHVLLFIAVAICGAIMFLTFMKTLGYDYVGARFQSFLDPESDIQKNTFQTYQSLLTIGSGGVFGLGLGNSRQKYSYLPVAQNDFIFSIICEELGLVGAILVILLFIVFVARGYYIAAKAPDKFSMLVAVGITTQIGLQALLNIAVVSNAFPNTGISLPFFSLGGSALVMQLAEMGIVLSISRRAAID